jgi:hypothetical protein
MNVLLGNDVDESSTNLGCCRYIQELKAQLKKYEQRIKTLEAERQKRDDEPEGKQQSLGSEINQARQRFLNGQRRSACC